jgi:WG containing repeat
MEKKFGAMDGSGKTVIEPQFDNSFRFSEGLAAVAIGEWGSTAGYIDKSGAWVIPAQDFGSGDAWAFQRVVVTK